VAMVAIRMAWVFAKSAFSYFKALQSSRAHRLCGQVLGESILIGWAGMRGIVSLTAALALPYTYPNGSNLEGRKEVIFMVFIVILLSLLIPGLTLPLLIRKLKIHDQSARHLLYKARKELIEVAKKTILHLHALKKISDDECDLLKAHFDLNKRLLELTDVGQIKAEDLESAKSLVIKEQRKKLIEIWERLEIDDKHLTELEQELDLEETNMTRLELT